MVVDLRSDTFTKPGSEMLSAMQSAPIGDDVFREDPTVNKLESKMTELFQKEAALFCPSGTMTNQIAIKTHTQPGDEVICDAGSHIYVYEGGGIAYNSGASVCVITGDRGRINAEQVKSSINPDDIHHPISSLVCLENTSNRGGGSCYDLDEIKSIKKVCTEHRLSLHLDGARLFNALIATGQKPTDYGNIFDSLSICLSKGLGCPVGSVLLGSTDFIKKARRIRKVLGGGMRQAGYLAAAGIYALDNHIDRLTEDHQHAKLLADVLHKKSFVKNVFPTETNIIIAELDENMSTRAFINLLKEKEIYCLAVSPTHIRMVTHLDVTPAMIEKTLTIIKSI